MMNKNLTIYILFIPIAVLIFTSKPAVSQCYTITNTSNTQNPSFTHTFTLTPSVGASGITSNHTIRLRTTDMNAWKLTASRVAITRSSGSGAAAENILDTDVSWSATLVGTGPPVGTATLTAPFNGTTTLNSISTAGGTIIVTGDNRTGSTTSCTNASALTRYWTVDVTLSVPQDFIFNSGTYTGMITYTLQNGP